MHIPQSNKCHIYAPKLLHVAAVFQINQHLTSAH